jgi:hypothetical protein
MEKRVCPRPDDSTIPSSILVTLLTESEITATTHPQIAFAQPMQLRLHGIHGGLLFELGWDDKQTQVQGASLDPGHFL